MPFAVQSERNGGVVVLRAAYLNHDGAIGTDDALPADFGDCWLLDLMVHCTGIATRAAAINTFGVFAALRNNQALTQPVGSGFWIPGAVTEVFARLYPEQMFWWPGYERMSVSAAEVDTNAVPTMTLEIKATVLRVRSQLSPVSEPPALQFTS